MTDVSIAESFGSHCEKDRTGSFKNCDRRQPVAEMSFLRLDFMDGGQQAGGRPCLDGAARGECRHSEGRIVVLESRFGGLQGQGEVECWNVFVIDSNSNVFHFYF